MKTTHKKHVVVGKVALVQEFYQPSNNKEQMIIEHCFSMNILKSNLSYFCSIQSMSYFYRHHYYKKMSYYSFFYYLFLLFIFIIYFYRMVMFYNIFPNDS